MMHRELAEWYSRKTGGMARLRERVAQYEAEHPGCVVTVVSSTKPVGPLQGSAPDMMPIMASFDPDILRW